MGNRRLRDLAEMETYERNGNRVTVEFDDDTNTWNVYSLKGRKTWPLGFVYEDENTWASSRHTHTGVPAEHGEGFASKEEAALSLIGAVPYHGAQYRYQPF